MNRNFSIPLFVVINHVILLNNLLSLIEVRGNHSKITMTQTPANFLFGKEKKYTMKNRVSKRKKSKILETNYRA